MWRYIEWSCVHRDVAVVCSLCLSVCWWWWSYCFAHVSQFPSSLAAVNPRIVWHMFSNLSCKNANTSTFRSSFNALTLLVGRQEWHPACKKSGCWFVGGDNLTVALHVLQLQLSPSPPSSLAPIKSGMETLWYLLSANHGPHEKWPFKRRER